MTSGSELRMETLEAGTILGHLKDHARARRWFGLGAQAEELFDAFTRIHVLDDWNVQFKATARKFEEAAQQIEEPPARIRTYLTAALYYHISALGVFRDSDARVDSYRRCVNAYGQVRDLFRVPAELCEYEWDGFTFTGYLRKASGREQAPCVVLLRGVDASREIELHTISSFLVERGLSTFAIDVAGQGESRFAGFTLQPDSSRSFGAALDYLETRPEIDSTRFAVVGQSFGGYLAPSIAAREKRLKACVAMGGFYSLADYVHPPMPRHNISMNLKIDEADFDKVKHAFSLEPVIEDIECPLFALNGGDDVVIPPSQTVKMFERAKCEGKKLRIYDGMPHTAYYDNNTICFDVADWIISKIH